MCMGYKTPMIYEILSANIRPLILVDLTQILSVLQAVFVLNPNLRITPRNLARHIIQRVCEGQTHGRRKDAAEEEVVVEMCSRGHEAHLHHDKLQVVLLLVSQPGPAKPSSADSQSPPASPWPMQCPGFIRQRRSTSVPTGNLQTQLQPKDRQRGCTRRALQR